MNPTLAPWSDYYMITGAAAASLTGLMFVVITLVAGQERIVKNMRDGVETFSSPVVVHFGAALLMSATMAVPWGSLGPAAATLALISVFGMVYATRVALRMSQQNRYEPEFDDWFWYAVVPLAAYVVVFAAAIALWSSSEQALYALAAGTMTLIFAGIRNAWDIVTYIAVEMKSKDPESD